MERPLIWPWGTFVGFGALSFLLTSSIALGSKKLKWDGGETPSATPEAGPLTSRIRQALVDVQFGRADDTFGWMHKVV